MRNGQATRLEADVLGSLEIPASSLFGINTARSLLNFNVTGRPLGGCRALVQALAQVKHAAALANCEVGALDAERSGVIVEACLEMARGGYDEYLVCDILEGSGGTSVNMNVNEVLANAALLKLGRLPGDYAALHPNDHVNLSQSTNDVVPTAVRFAAFAAASPVETELRELACSLERKSSQFAGVMRLGRTCMQDAQPMTLGQALGGYASAVRRHSEQISGLRQMMLTIPLGGTAIGTGFGSRQGYREAVLRSLAHLTGCALLPAEDCFDAMQNADDCARLSAEVKTAANTLWKVGNDLIVLSSGPDGGIAEISLPEVQAGSSIMPGKVNPVLPMTMCQVALAICGNDLSVSLASQQGLLELNHYELLIADRLLDSMSMLSGAIAAFRQRCIDGIEANEERSWDHLRNSSALATVLVAEMGYAEVSALVQKARESGQTFIDHAVATGVLTDAQVRAALSRAIRSREP